ncbi:ARM repeat-containing protein [Sanghuangporus baumii]|uniref:ARM repeat-containing protein n=1 Tax=Sanghuangporus baumii TaxID=108892 RepID=A0A9Q5I064_SANBA|nr:ARM repeat-containing protein [Sanghuangporus baumii]
MQADFLPVLSQADIEQAAFLIQSAYIPGQDVEEARRMQQQLFEIQKKPEAWGLILPLLDHPDPNVEFFGAHTAQVKIVRDWYASHSPRFQASAHTWSIYIRDTFPQEHALPLVHILVAASTRVIVTGKSKVTLRKLFVAISSLALKLVPGRPPRWPDWILSVVTTLSGGGGRPEHILEFLEIAAEEVGSSDLISTSKAQMQQSLLDAAPLVTEAITNALLSHSASPSERDAAFKCLEAWINYLRGDELTSIIPILVKLLSNEENFVGASDVLQEVLNASSFSDGFGIKILTEPLLAFLETGGLPIVQQTISAGEVDEVSRSLCKLLVSLGEHSISYIASHLSTTRVQNFVRMLITYTSLPGYYGVDEEESEMTLSFWYLLQEALWSVDYGVDVAEDALAEWAESIQGKSSDARPDYEEFKAPDHGPARPIYIELIQVLRKKVTWPRRSELARWTRGALKYRDIKLAGESNHSSDQIDKFQVYRRDVGDTLINAYYILREELLRIYVDELIILVETRHPNDGWEDVESILHCLMSVQEAVVVSENVELQRLFGAEVIGRLPRSGQDRVRRTALSLIGTYATWFTVPIDNRYLLTCLSYVAEALDEPALCLSAANALRDLCDANRTALAQHIVEFGQLHARLPSIPDSEKAKIVQSIASVVQALPPEQQIEPVETIVAPIVEKLAEALSVKGPFQDAARNVAVQQLQALTGVAKGLTRQSDILFAYEDEDEITATLEKIEAARNDSRMVNLQDGIIEEIRAVTLQWSTDATTADAMSNLIVAITALPADVTLLSLPPVVLFEIVCVAMFRHQSAIWLSLAAMLIHQLDPPSLSSLLTEPDDRSRSTVLMGLPIIYDATFRSLQEPGAMEADSMKNPDVVQAFFGCMEMVAQHFTDTMFDMPSNAMNDLMAFTIRALSLQERYSLVSACKFLVYLINRSLSSAELEEKARTLVQTRFQPVVKSVLCGIAGASPTSTTQNLVDLLLALVSRCPNEMRVWVPEILFSEDFIPTKAQREDKERFAKAVLSSRSTRKMREAAQQFALVAKGLEGSSFGYASVTIHILLNTMSMASQHSEQPTATVSMYQTSTHTHTASAAAAHPNETFVHKTSEKVLDSATDEAGKQAVDYAVDNGPQDLDDAKEKAKGLWAKYCGCFSSLS